MEKYLGACIGVLLLTACVSASRRAEIAPAQVYFEEDKPPTCPVEKVGSLAVRVSSTAIGDDAVEADLKKEVGRKARERRADAVINTKWQKLLTVVVARSGSGASAGAEPPAWREVTGTLVRFVDPACTG